MREENQEESDISQSVQNVAIGFMALLKAVKHGVTHGFDEEVVEALEEMVERLDFLIEDEKGE